jgi:hypothetical protein
MSAILLLLLCIVVIALAKKQKVDGYIKLKKSNVEFAKVIASVFVTNFDFCTLSVCPNS